MAAISVAKITFTKIGVRKNTPTDSKHSIADNGMYCGRGQTLKVIAKQRSSGTMLLSIDVSIKW